MDVVTVSDRGREGTDDASLFTEALTPVEITIQALTPKDGSCSPHVPWSGTFRSIQVMSRSQASASSCTPWCPFSA